MFFLSRSILTRAASLAMLGGGALLLMADSAECPDGVAEARFDATFTSTCPTDFTPSASGTVHILLPATKQDSDQETSLRSGLKSGGIEVQNSNISRSGGSGLCTVGSFSFSRESGPTRLRCGSVFLSSASQQKVTCDGTSTKPLALRFGIGTRDFSSDASTDAASKPDASSSSSGNTGNNEGGIGDGEDLGNGGSQQPAPSASSEDLGKALTCTITFTKI